MFDALRYKEKRDSCTEQGESFPTSVDKGNGRS